MTCHFLSGYWLPFSWIVSWRLFQQSVEFLYVWPLLLVTLALTAYLAAAMTLKWPFRHDRWRREYWLIFLNLLFVPATIAIADVGSVNPNPMPHHPNTLGIWVCNGIFAACALLGIFWVYRMKGLRWFALAVVLLQLWMLIGAGFIAGMSLTGDWL